MYYLQYIYLLCANCIQLLGLSTGSTRVSWGSIGFHGATMRKSLRLRLCCGSELPGALHCALHYEAVRRAAPLAAPHKMIKMAEDMELHKGFAVQYCAVHTTTIKFIHNVYQYFSMHESGSLHSVHLNQCNRDCQQGILSMSRCGSESAAVANAVTHTHTHHAFTANL